MEFERPVPDYDEMPASDVPFGSAFCNNDAARWMNTYIKCDPAGLVTLAANEVLILNVANGEVTKGNATDMVFVLPRKLAPA